MKKILGTLMLTCALATSTAVFAQSGDQMKQDADAPKQDSMKNDQMKKEKKAKKAAKKPAKKVTKTAAKAPNLSAGAVVASMEQPLS